MAKKNENPSVKINKTKDVKIRMVGKATTNQSGITIKKTRAVTEMPHSPRQTRGENQKSNQQSVINMDGQGSHCGRESERRGEKSKIQTGNRRDVECKIWSSDKKNTDIGSRDKQKGLYTSKIKKGEHYIQSSKTVIHKMSSHVNKADNTNREEEEAPQENRGTYIYPAFDQMSNRKNEDFKKKVQRISLKSSSALTSAQARVDNSNEEVHQDYGSKSVVIQKGRLPSFHGNVLYKTNRIRTNEKRNGKNFENREDIKGKTQLRQKEIYQENQKEGQEGKQPRTDKGDKTGRFGKKRMINTMKVGAVYQVKKAGAAMVQSPQQEEYRRKQWMESQIQNYGVAAIRKEAVWTGHVIKDIMAFAWKQIKLLLTTIVGAVLPLFLPILAVVLAIVLIVNVFSLLFTQHQQAIPQAVNVSEEVLAYRQEVSQIAATYDMSQYIELILAVMMQESGGQGLDPMQSSEGAYNTQYPRVPNGITDPIYSIECGIQELKYALVAAECTGPGDLEHIKLALQGYNFGSGYISWAVSRDGGYTPENAALFSDIWAERYGWSSYGDKDYVPHVLRYYALAAAGNGNAIIAEGMRYMGMPYVYGGSSPETSFDCSGFIYYVYNQCGYQVPRATAQGFYDMSLPISAEEARPGDLVFFEHTYDFYERITHIGIYIGNGQMMHFGNPGKISPISSFGNKFVGYGRLPAPTE